MALVDGKSFPTVNFLSKSLNNSFQNNLRQATLQAPPRRDPGEHQSGCLVFVATQVPACLQTAVLVPDPAALAQRIVGFRIP